MSSVDIKPAPFLTYGLTPGSSSHRESALLFQKNMNNEQSNLNKIGGRRKSRKRKGGALVVPQFPPSGPQVGPVNANSMSVVGNTTLVTSINDAGNDCYATNSCIKGGTYKRRSYKRRSSSRKRSHKRGSHKRRHHRKSSKK